MINDDEIDNLIKSTNMYDLVSRYVNIKKIGTDYKGLCPFHNDTKPSFNVSESKKIAKCFSCNGGGNPITFLRQIENISFYDALYKLASINNIELSIKKREINPKIISLRNINNFVCNIYKDNLLNKLIYKEAQSYLKKRGLNIDIIKLFDIGYASGDLLYDILLDNSFVKEDILDSTLVKEMDNKYLNFFNQRIIFPIKDEFDNVCGFSGRTWFSEQDGLPKYLNTKENIVFKKSQILYNLNLAKEFIKKNDRVFIYEGYMDVISSYLSGIKESVGLMGLNVSCFHIEKLEKLTKNVILVLDTDNAGTKALENAYIEFSKKNFNCKCLILNGAKDCNEYLLKYGQRSFYEYALSNQLDVCEYLIKDVLTKIDKKNKSLVFESKQRLKKLLDARNLDDNDYYYELFNSYLYKRKNIKEKEKSVILKLDIYYFELASQLFFYITTDIKCFVLFYNIYEKLDILINFDDNIKRIFEILISNILEYQCYNKEDFYYKVKEEEKIVYLENIINFLNSKEIYFDIYEFGYELIECVEHAVEKMNLEYIDIFKEDYEFNRNVITSYVYDLQKLKYELKEYIDTQVRCYVNE